MDNGMWSVDTIVFSDDADTSLLVTPSGVAAAGTYTVELRNADVEFGSAFQFAFTCYPPPPPVTIVRPLAGCGGTGSAFALLPQSLCHVGHVGISQQRPRASSAGGS